MTTEDQRAELANIAARSRVAHKVIQRLVDTVDLDADAPYHPDVRHELRDATMRMATLASAVELMMSHLYYAKSRIDKMGD